MQGFEKYTQFKHLRTVTHRHILAVSCGNKAFPLKFSMALVKNKDKRDSAA